MKKELKEVAVYTAKDGKVFYDDQQCLEYEAFLDKEAEFKEAEEHVDSLKLSVTDDKFPYIPLGVFLFEDGNMLRIKSEMRRRLQNVESAEGYEYVSLNNKKDARMLAEVMARAAAKHCKIDSAKILRTTGRLTFPCTVLWGQGYGWGRVMGSFQKDFKMIEKFCRINGYKVSLEKIED